MRGFLVVVPIFLVGAFAQPAQPPAFEVVHDGGQQLGDVAWSLVERPEGGFLIASEHLLDEKVDSHNRAARVLVANPAGTVEKTVPLPGFTHAHRIRKLPDGRFIVAGNKKGHGASIALLDGDGTVLDVHGRLVGGDRPNAATDAIPTPDGGVLLACHDGLRGFLTKLDAAFKTQWSTAVVTNLHYVKSAVQLPGGDCVMVGQHGGGKGVHLARWNRVGTLLEEQVHRPDRSTNKGRKLILNRAGQVIVTGMLGSGGRGQFLFMKLDPAKLAEPLLTVRVAMPDSVSNYGQAITQCRDGSYVIAGRSGRDGSHLLSMVRVDGAGKVIAGPKYFGRSDPDSGEAGYDVVECRDGSIAVVGMHGTKLLDGGKITDISPGTDVFLVRTHLDAD